MSEIVLVAGLPGSGKSFFAAELAARLGGSHINSDSIRRANHAMGRYSDNDRLAVYREMAKIAEPLLMQKPVVIDATFSAQSMRNIFFELAKRKSVAIIFILIEAEEAVIKKRLKKPRTDSEADFQVYLKLKNEFEPILAPHAVIQSRDGEVSSMIEEAVHYIDIFRESKPC